VINKSSNLTCITGYKVTDHMTNGHYVFHSTVQPHHPTGISKNKVIIPHKSSLPF